MFPYEDSETVSVRPSVRTPSVRTPRKKNHPGFVNISPTLVIDHQWKGLHEYYSILKPKI